MFTQSYITSKAKLLLNHPLISGSRVILVGSFIANILNYIFNLSMLRLLSVEEYGLLTALSSLIVLFGIFNVTFSNLYAKFAAMFYGRDDKSGRYHLIRVGIKTIIVFSIILLVLQIIFIQPFASFIHVNDTTLLVLIFISNFFSMISSLPYGFLQGYMKFIIVSILSITQPILKVVIGVSLVLLGYSLFGVVCAIVLSSMIPVVFSYWYIYTHYSKDKAQTPFDTDAFMKDLYHYGYTFFFSAIGLTLLSNTDIIIVRHFFDATTSGQYAALSLMGKAIFYLTAPINMVFFPLIAYKKERKERLFHTVLLALGIVALAAFLISLVYILLPNVVLSIFAPGAQYKVLSVYLGFFSIYILFFSLASVFNNFFLSIGKTEVFLFTLIAAILQIVLLFLFHSSLYQVITVLFVVAFLLCMSFLVYYLMYGKD